MNDSLKLMNELRDLRGRSKDAMASGDTETALKLSGMIEQREADWEAACEAERLAAAEQPPAAAPVDPQPVAPQRRPRSLAEAVLGFRDEFRGVDATGNNPIRKQVWLNADGDTSRDSSTSTTTPTTLPTPSKVVFPTVPESWEYNLDTSLMEPLGFVGTLPTGTCNGALHYFQANDANALKAAKWKPGEVKKEQTLSWVPKTANEGTIAHWVPVSKLALNDYGQLMSIINQELIAGLHRAADDVALNSDDDGGIVGVLNSGITAYTAKSGDTLIDSMHRMITQSILDTGVAPTHVAMHPLVREKIDLMKSTDGSYLNLDKWGLTVVDDVNLMSGSSSSPTYDMLVYAPSGATWYSTDPTTVTVGTINQQMVENTLTVLAEESHLMCVRRPKSFVRLTGIAL